MRLIDVDSLIKEVNENKELFEKERVYLEGLLLNAPTIIWCGETSDGLPLMDLRPRPQGEWIYDSDHSITIDMYKCSVCGCYGSTHFNYCQNCGAKMKGGAEE